VRGLVSGRSSPGETPRSHTARDIRQQLRHVFALGDRIHPDGDEHAQSVAFDDLDEQHFDIRRVTRDASLHIGRECVQLFLSGIV